MAQLTGFCARSSLRSAALALVGLGVVATAFGVGRGEGRLAAASNSGRSDLDDDGLTDEQEDVLGTRVDLADTDADGFSDLEERARGSDPLAQNSVPAAQGFALGTLASLEGDQVSFLSAVYVDGASAEAFDVRLGIVYGGVPIYFRPSSFQYKRAFVRAGADTVDSLTVLEIAISQRLVQRLGQIDMFSVVRSTSPGAPGVAVSVVPLINFAGVIVSAESEELNYSPVNGGNGTPTGITYRPLAGDSGIPSSWTGGEICFQRTAAVGVDGVSVVHEVESADCQPMDTYCNPDACSASRGMSITLPDPAALAGG